jgi:hypothetical protein
MIETRVFHTSMDPRGFIRTQVKPGSSIELKDAQENTQAVIDISGGSNYPILVNLTEIRSISKEARDHFSMRGRKPNVLGIAMVVNRPVSVIIGNFFLGLNKPTVPTKLFVSERTAEKWILDEFGK